MAEQIPDQHGSAPGSGSGSDQWPTQAPWPRQPATPGADAGAGAGAGLAAGADAAAGRVAIPACPPMPPMPPAPPSYAPDAGRQLADPPAAPEPDGYELAQPHHDEPAHDWPLAQPQAAPATGTYPLASPQAAPPADDYPLAQPQAAPPADAYALAAPQAAPATDGYPLAAPVNSGVAQGQYSAYPPFPPPVVPVAPKVAPVAPKVAPRVGVRRAVGVGAIAALVVAAAAGVTALVFSGGGGSSGGGPSGGGTSTPVASGPRQLKQAWMVRNTAGQGSTQLYGGWVTGKYAVRVDQSGVTAYNLSDGSQAWKAAMPSGEQQPCTASPTLSAGGVATVGFGGAAECKVLVGLDTATGKTLWTLPLTKPNDSLGVFAQTYIQGSVATLISPALITGLNIGTGKPVWTYHPRGEFCDVYPNGTTGVVLVSDFCAAASPGYSLSALNPLTGKVEWLRSETGDINFDSVLSSDPLAATEEGGAGQKPYLFDSSGNAKPINTPSGTSTTPDAFDDSTPSQVVGGKLVAQAAGEVGGQNATGGMIDAFDTATGNRAWSYSGEGGDGAELLAPTGDGRLYALSTGAILGTPELVRLDPATGRSTVLSALTIGTAWDVSDDRLFAAPGGGLVVFGTMSDPDVGLFR